MNSLCIFRSLYLVHRQKRPCGRTRAAICADTHPFKAGHAAGPAPAAAPRRRWLVRWLVQWLVQRLVPPGVRGHDSVLGQSRCSSAAAFRAVGWEEPPGPGLLLQAGCRRCHWPQTHRPQQHLHRHRPCQRHRVPSCPELAPDNSRFTSSPSLVQRSEIIYTRKTT